MSRPLFQVVGLSKRFGSRVALDGVSFEVQPGEIFGMLGANGAGKSTAFSLINGVLEPDAGSILFRGERIRTSDRSYRAKLGVIFQSPSSDPLLTAIENLWLAARLYGVARDQARSRIQEVLALVGLQDRAHERVGTFSGGMRRRLEIARVLLHEPELLLLDEPGHGLDLATLRHIWEHLRGLIRARGSAIVMTTHTPEEAEYCDRLALLEAGRVLKCETPEALRQSLGGDVIAAQPSDGDVNRLAKEIGSRLGVSTRVIDDTVFVEARNGHEMIPKLVSALPAGELRAIHLRPPSLADAFAKLTGRALP